MLDKVSDVDDEQHKPKMSIRFIWEPFLEECGSALVGEVLIFIYCIHLLPSIKRNGHGHGRGHRDGTLSQ